SLSATLFIRGCLRDVKEMHGPEYLWHRYLSALEDERSFRQAAADAAKKAVQEEELAAKALHSAEHESHQEQAAHWKERASLLKEWAGEASQSSRYGLDSYTQMLKGAR